MEQHSRHEFGAVNHALCAALRQLLNEFASKALRESEICRRVVARLWRPEDSGFFMGGGGAWGESSGGAWMGGGIPDKPRVFPKDKVLIRPYLGLNTG